MFNSPPLSIARYNFKRKEDSKLKWLFTKDPASDFFNHFFFQRNLWFSTFIHRLTQGLKCYTDVFQKFGPDGFVVKIALSNYLALRHFLKKTWFCTSAKRKWPSYNSFSVLSGNLNQEWLQTPQNFFHTHLFFSQINWVNWFVKIEMKEKCTSSNCRKKMLYLFFFNATIQTKVQRFHTKIKETGTPLTNVV